MPLNESVLSEREQLEFYESFEARKERNRDITKKIHREAQDRAKRSQRDGVKEWR